MGYVYSQRTGRFELRCCCRDAGLIAVGYSGHAAGLNSPEMEHEVGIGPIPRGDYRIVVRGHPRFAAPAFFLQPSAATAKKLAALKRSGFWMHGDNVHGDQSASRGCIILPRDARAVVERGVRAGHGSLTVEP